MGHFYFTSAVCKLFEQEKLDHSNLKTTWQKANDRFLESQRLIMADLRRMDAVLTADQRLQIAGQHFSSNSLPKGIYAFKRLEISQWFIVLLLVIVRHRIT